LAPPDIPAIATDARKIVQQVLRITAPDSATHPHAPYIATGRNENCKFAALEIVNCRHLCV